MPLVAGAPPEHSASFLQAVIEHITDFVTVLSGDGRVMYTSPSVTTALGYTPDEMLGADGFALVHPADRARIRAVLTAALAHPELHTVEQFRYRHKDGSWRVMESSGTNQLHNLEVQGLVINTRDVTERARAEGALARSEAEFRGLIERAPVGIYRTSLDGRFLLANPALVAMLGYDSVEQVRQLDIARDVYADPGQRAELIERIERGESPVAEVEWKRRDGRRFTVRLSAAILRERGGVLTGFEVFVEDVSAQRQFEERRRHAQRLEAIGRLAGGVAHEFNNILTVVLSNCELLLDQLSLGDPRRERVTDIRASGLRAAELTRQLLAFGRRQMLQNSMLDLNAVVRGAEGVLRRLIGPDVRLELALDPALGPVRADHGQIEHVIVTLAVNARDAMPDGGRLTIETANIDVDQAHASANAGVTPGSYAMVSVADTGIGMDAETSSHIFDPFFNKLATGTGLGLATAYGIVRQSGGDVLVSSEPGRGATFRVHLPRIAEPQPVAKEHELLPTIKQGALG